MKNLFVFLMIFFATTNVLASDYNNITINYTSDYTLSSGINYLKDIEPINSDGTVNVVIEIPTGTNEKWEVSKKTGDIEWEFKKGKPRIVKFLGYPTNYGMIPRTLLPKNLGGDGDPLDVILIGSYIERGKIVNGKVIGVLKMLDGGEVDDKILMIHKNSPLSKAKTIEDPRPLCYLARRAPFESQEHCRAAAVL